GPRAGADGSPAGELQRRGRPGDRRGRRSARPRARRGRAARPHGRGRALAGARREARRHRRAGRAHRARDPQPRDRRPEPRAAARARARIALRRRAPPHPGRARARRATGGRAPPLRASRGLPLRAGRSGRAGPRDARGVPPPPRGGRRDARDGAGGRRHGARRPREAPPGADQPARERARRHDRRGGRATHALGRGRQRARCRRARGARQRPRRAGGRAAAPLRAVLLDQAERDGPRARDRAAHDRGARRPDLGERGERARPDRERRAAAGRGGRAMTASGLLVAILYLLPALLWAIIARQLWAYLRTARPRSPTFNVFRLATSGIALHLFSHVALALLPAASPSTLALGLGLARDLTLVGSLALGRHAIRLMPVPERPPGPAWLAANYGFAASAGLALTLAHAFPDT